ncbi:MULTISPECIES: hypothetical protein [Acinetobacter]|uniref:hypothetical protein n=1 Tax=Acinetobacter TaxID=469 RepID=UPI001443F307|nr:MULTISPECIES: hypothetical protein [Acinetobacter]
MKKVLVILCLFCGVIFWTAQSLGYDKIISLLRQPFQTSAEDKRLQDWIIYEKFLLNMEIPDLDPYPKVDISKNYLDQMLLVIIKNTPKVISSNNNNIETLNSLNFISPEFQEIVALEIEALNTQNQLMQENIVDYYKKHKTTQSYLQEPVLKLTAKSQYLLQQSELKNLNYLKVLSFKNDRRLKNLNADTLQDWIYYLEFEHQQNPKDPVWDTMKILKEMGNRSSSDDQILLKNYQNQKFKTDHYQKIQQLNILAIQSNLNLFSDFSKPQNIQQASEQLKKLNELLKTNDFKDAMEISNKIEELTQQIHQEMILGLEKGFI